jgi:dihydroneopterin aldolase
VTNVPAPGIDPPDRIELRGLRALGVHGVLPEERQRPQPFEVDIDLEVDLLRAGRSDALADTIDYGKVAEAVAAAVAGPHVDLLEALAERIATAACRAAGMEPHEPGPQTASDGGPDRVPGSGAPDQSGPDQSGPARLRVLSPPGPAVTAVTVAVRKLRPPVGVDMSSAGVRIHRYPDQLGGPAGASAPAGDR